MSARQLKRLGKLAAASSAAHESVSEEELEEKRPANVGFAFLLDDDSDSDKSDQEDDNDEASVPPPAPVAPTPPASSNKSAKKKNKKKKKSTKQTDNHEHDQEQENDEDDVDQLLDQLASAAALSTDATETRRHHAQNALLSVQLNAINADKEMKRIFGVSGTGARAPTKRDPRKKTAKKVFLITPDDNWPRPPTFVGGGIRWTRTNRPKGSGWSASCHYYEITWSIAYKKLQQEFEMLQQTHDPNVIGHFVQRTPFHIDALLQMSEVFQHHGQMDHASDCIKRCIYALELAWADQFDVTQGNCRMDYYTPHNNGFYRALFLLMKQVGRRGCMRSAFEIARLILSLDPHGDPMCVLLAIDYYALMSRQCQFLIDLVDSKLMAVDRLKEQTSQAKKPSVNEHEITALPNLQFSLALAHFFEGDQDNAKAQLARALRQFPMVLVRLLDKCGVKTSCSSWTSIVSHPLFANASEGSRLVQHLVEIYIQRQFSVWKVTEVQQLLLSAAQDAIQGGEKAPVEDLAPVLYKYQRAVASDYSDDITTLPPDHPMMQPRPQMANGEPVDEELLMELAHQAQAQAAANGGNLPADANPLLLFLQTLLPWNQIQRNE